MQNDCSQNKMKGMTKEREKKEKKKAEKFFLFFLILFSSSFSPLRAGKM